MFWKKATIIVGGPLVILLMLVAGHNYNLFRTTLWHDALMHLLGGGFLVITCCGTLWHLWWKRHPGRPARPAPVKAGLITALFITAIVWEILEIRYDLSPNWTHSKLDTVTDIAWALAGAAIALRFIRLKR